MFKFFRKIRLGSISKNRLSKYFIYAIGEIILVVIGILIALNLNNQNEQRKTEAKIELIFEEIMEELIADIEATEMPLRYFAIRDSLVRLVLSENVSKEDYKNDQKGLNTLLNWSNRVELTHYAFDALMQDINSIPDKFKPVIPDLRVLYNRYKIHVEKANSKFENVVLNYQKFAKDNYSWYVLRNEQEWDQKIEYMLNNFRYRSTVQEYGNAGMNQQMKLSINYRKQAIHCYQKIAKILNKPVYHSSFTFDEALAEKLVGEWQIIGSPEDIVIHFIKDKRLYGKDKNNPNDQWEIFYVPQFNKIVDDDLDYATIVQENDEVILKFHREFDIKKIN
jgi:hypothetical protein